MPEIKVIADPVICVVVLNGVATGV